MHFLTYVMEHAFLIFQHRILFGGNLPLSHYNIYYNKKYMILLEKFVFLTSSLERWGVNTGQGPSFEAFLLDHQDMVSVFISTPR